MYRYSHLCNKDGGGGERKVMRKERKEGYEEGEEGDMRRGMEEGR